MPVGVIRAALATLVSTAELEAPVWGVKSLFGCEPNAIPTKTSVCVGLASTLIGATIRGASVQQRAQVGAQIRPPGSCGFGQYAALNDPSFFNYKDLSIRIPAPGVLREEGKVIVRGSNTKHLHDDTFEPGGTIDETVTQSAAVTLKRIAR